MKTVLSLLAQVIVLFENYLSGANFQNNLVINSYENTIHLNNNIFSQNTIQFENIIGFIVINEILLL